MTPESVGMIVFIVVIFMLALDIWLVADREKDNTISAVVRKWCARYPLIVFGLGMLMAHWLRW